MYYYFIIALQVYCFYHIYKNGNNYYWYFIVFFIPLIGSIVYILTQVINKKEVANITKELTTIINPTKKVRDLEQELEFSNTFKNKINLADAFLEIKDYKNAILHYENALDSNFKNDPFTINKLIKCYFEVKNFDKVIENSIKIKLDKDFKESIYFYAFSLEQKNNLIEAEAQFRKVDIRYSNYEERIELSKFFIRRTKKLDAKEVLQEIILEIKSMANKNAKKYKQVLLEAEKLMDEV